MEISGGKFANIDTGVAFFNGVSVENNNLQYLTLEELDNLRDVMTQVVAQYSMEMEDDRNGIFTPISNDLATAHVARSIACKILTRATNEQRRRYASMLVH